jgi:multiple sugar transport system substrate-binding protein
MGKKYQVATLRYAGLGGMGAAVENWGTPWLEANAVKMERGQFGQQELEEKILQAQVTNTYLADMVQFNANAAGDVMGGGFLREVSPDIQKLVDMEDVLPLFRSLMSWKGKQYAFPYDGDKHMMAFRRDLFANADNQVKFKQKYGYDMDPKLGPRTWEQHRNYAEFFSGQDWNKNGKPDEAGFAHMTKRKDTAWWGFLSRASAYAKHPDDQGFFFDLDTFEPRINSPAFVKALTEWKEENEKWGLKGATSLSWGDEGEAFRGGRVAMCVGWMGVAESDPSLCAPEVVGNAFNSILPGAKEVYNAKAKKWETPAQPNAAPFIAFGGWVMAVPKNSKNPDAAFDFASFMSGREMSLKLVTNPTGSQPFRASHLANIADWTERNSKLPKDVAESYLSAEKATMEHPNRVTDLRIPGFSQYRDAAELAISQGMAGEKAPQAALDECAVAWKEITQRVGGADKQKDYYRAAVGG